METIRQFTAESRCPGGIAKPALSGPRFGHIIAAPALESAASQSHVLDRRRSTHRVPNTSQMPANIDRLLSKSIYPDSALSEPLKPALARDIGLGTPTRNVCARRSKAGVICYANQFHRD